MAKNMYEFEYPEQHYPTYNFLNEDNRDIAIAEYNSAHENLKSEEKFFNHTTSIIILIIGVLLSVFLGQNTDIKNYVEANTDNALFFFLSLSINYIFSAIIIIYFAGRYKEICYAARKMVILRSLLGVSYGRIHMILPTWRIEGADNPHAIKTFREWGNYTHLPIYLVVIISTAIFLYLIQNQISLLNGLLFSFVYSLSLLLIYRKSGYDNHENIWLLIAKYASFLLTTKLVKNFEYIIYRAKLQTFEMHRLDIAISNKLIPMLLHLEDRRFYNHAGISFRSIARALIDNRKYGKRLGASTITQQFVRTLFIKDFHSPAKRKLLEFILAKWAEKAFIKRDILYMYIGAVQFERGIQGLPAAMHYFFGEIIKNPNNAQSFFLIERISNINSKLLPKVLTNIKSAVDADLLIRSDIEDLISIYRTQINNHKIYDDENVLIRIEDFLDTL